MFTFIFFMQPCDCISWGDTWIIKSRHMAETLKSKLPSLSYTIQETNSMCLSILLSLREKTLEYSKKLKPCFKSLPKSSETHLPNIHSKEKHRAFLVFGKTWGKNKTQGNKSGHLNTNVQTSPHTESSYKMLTQYHVRIHMGVHLGKHGIKPCPNWASYRSHH